MAPHATGGLESLPNGHTSLPLNGSTTAPPEAADSPRPNILYIMADQMAAPMLKAYDPESVVQTPNIDKLAENGVVFESAYCNSPLCAPSRFCMVSGQLPSKIRGYDNASQISSDIPTFAHFLRAEGYETVLAGKMHFIGPDQLHGFEYRLTSDIYPGDFGWAVNWDKPDERQEWYHNMSSVLQAGPCVRSNQLDYDEEVLYKVSELCSDSGLNAPVPRLNRTSLSICKLGGKPKNTGLLKTQLYELWLRSVQSTQWLYDYVRQGPSKRPFCLTVSFTHPHDPYAITEDLWDLYQDTEIPMPKIDILQQDQDEHSKRILRSIDLWGQDLAPEAVRRARRAYFGACTYVDNQVGKLLKVLKDCHLDKNTIIVFSGDHGDMLGERGLWYKMSFYEMSARVPMIINYPPLFAPRRVKESVSTMDLPPTLMQLIGSRVDELLSLDGKSLYPYLLGQSGKDEVFGEYMGETTITPLYMIRRGQYKYVASLAEPPKSIHADSKSLSLWEQLYNLQEDPSELKNLILSTDPRHEIAAMKFRDEARRKWDFVRIHFDVLASQRQRRICFKALKTGKFAAWDYEPPQEGTTKYIRSTIPLDDLELRARYPPVDAFGKALSVAQPHGQAGARGE